MSYASISVIVPCYNQAQYLDECLQSVLDQTYQDWECIIVNDGSQDNTEEVAKRWVKKDARFSYLYQNNKGVSSARNTGMKYAKGEWLQLLDGDDLLAINKLSLSAQYFNSDFNFIYCDFSLLTEGKITEAFCDLNRYQLTMDNLIKYWDDGLNIPIHSPLFRKDLKGTLIFNENYDLQEDWLFWIELFKSEKVASRFIEEKLIIYRSHPESNSKDFIKMTNNIDQVYLFAYDKIMNSDQKTIFFIKVLHKFTHHLRKVEKLTENLQKVNNSKLMILRRIMYKITGK